MSGQNPSPKGSAESPPPRASQALRRAHSARQPGGMIGKGLWLFWTVAACLSCAFLWSAFSGSRGFLSLLEQQHSVSVIEQENKKILQQNQTIKKEIYLLRNSPSFLRKVAREELGYICPGEKVYLPADMPPDREDAASPP